MSDERQEEPLHALIIGAGPAGLTAAIYLARFRRRILLIDAASSRARWIPTSHNMPGFPRGVSGHDLLAKLVEQAAEYGVEVRRGQVESLSRDADLFVAHTSLGSFTSQFVVMATGTLDHLPPLASAEDAVKRGVLRVCPVCDGFEAIGKRISVIGNGSHAAREAEFLRTYSDQVTLIRLRDEGEPVGRSDSASQQLEVIDATLAELDLADDAVWLRPVNGPARRFDVCYSALGCSPQSRLAANLGARLDESGAIVVTLHQETTVPGLYATGDVVRGLNQVAVAAGESAIAATHIHNRLPRF